jgi:hypothetical protein
LEDESACGRPDQPPDLPRGARERHVPAEQTRLREVDDERRVDRSVEALPDGEDCDSGAEDDRRLGAGEPFPRGRDDDERPRPHDAHEREPAHTAVTLHELHDGQLR